jgi:hypothetical protein
VWRSKLCHTARRTICLGPVADKCDSQASFFQFIILCSRLKHPSECLYKIDDIYGDSSGELSVRSCGPELLSKVIWITYDIQNRRPSSSVTGMRIPLSPSFLKPFKNDIECNVELVELAKAFSVQQHENFGF